ncbi:sulfite exporter TauE/SafE family protein [Sphingobium sp. CR2-8]|uniref:sulfite exporter TauE/SafE family protein n=1 Tax=Sphingobium sp. CR2-8 TaxID=1306534 RepID=UPI002DB91E58|nr:sulfite exporter TauE/SafE family protein [Sphingobium sp. CR2-8]MEC3911946.1 sulfite exporter TauE/SafE family protein [Sphingobium sp. CR2-8]
MAARGNRTAVTGSIDLFHATAGLLVGVLVGLTGVGGGSLMTPLLVLFFGVSAKTAVGTDLLFAAITKIAGSAVHGKRETIEWPIVRRMALGSVPAAILTLILLRQVGSVGQSSEKIILTALAALLALTSVAILCRKWLFRHRGDLTTQRPAGITFAATTILGALIGGAVSLSSVGAGAIGVTVLLILYPRLQMARIVGSDIAHAVPLALIAGTGHWLMGDVNGVLLTNLLIGSIPGVVLGSYLSSHAPDRILQPLLAAVLALSAWQLFVKARAPEPTHVAAPALVQPH